ncbi:MAG: hypothetical protein K9N34_01000 [Candidatus Marinimicrobia bacterium]|nr:hypothetical protein [Candidatus Neomarinimicrobiota bacterium]MCF7841155.1 hypothetical protein [Candidatus Neomarinimicrobiota bacterium]MCF7901944.1 hypothetical protein [Candidatus Neomarinimicrobiota bacterium]
MKAGDFQIQRLTQPTSGFDPTHSIQHQGHPGAGKAGNAAKDVTPFSQVLDTKIKETEGLKFSAHAVRRLDDRGIMLSSHEVSRLESGVKKMVDKGAQSSLLLMDDNAYIVSVKNRTVVTAMDMQTVRDNVFTNIDSVAFL